MTNDEQGPVGADGRGDARAPYERPELRELSVSETLTGAIVFTEELFNESGDKRGGPTTS
jgi:hypothetical protein